MRRATSRDLTSWKVSDSDALPQLPAWASPGRTWAPGGRDWLAFHSADEAYASRGMTVRPLDGKDAVPTLG